MLGSAGFGSRSAASEAAPFPAAPGSDGVKVSMTVRRLGLAALIMAGTMAASVLHAGAARASDGPLVTPGRASQHSLQTRCGHASWYRAAGKVGQGVHLVRGASVRVTNRANGRTVAVVINGRGISIPGRAILLSDDAFALLAPLAEGTTRVCITW